MTSITPRSARILFASTLALAALGAATALSAAPAPSSTATGTAAGKRMYKPYAVTPKSDACAATTNAGPLKVTSDPEEGGQVTAARSKGKADVSDMHVTKHVDSASPKLMDAPAASTTCPPVQH